MSHLPVFRCNKKNHEQMPIHYLCTQEKCVNKGIFLGCLHCGQDQHRFHIDNYTSLKIFLHSARENNNLPQHISESYPSVVASLLKNIYNTDKLQSFRQYIYQLIQEIKKPHPEKDDFPLTRQMVILRNQATQFEASKKPKQPQQFKAYQQEKKTSPKNAISPVFTFKQQQSHKLYELVTPYTIKHMRNQHFTAALAYPSLSTFKQPVVQFTFHVHKRKPDWLGLGIALDKSSNTYTLKEKGFFILVSNGWAFLEDSQIQTAITFGESDKVTFRVDRSKNMIVVFKNDREFDPYLVDVNLSNAFGDLHPCVVFFYQNDIVDICR